MHRAEVLDRVKTLICQDRNGIHGLPEQTHGAIADLWNSLLMAKGAKIQLDAQDVAVMMVLFKVARYTMNASHEDNVLDMVAYPAIAGELGDFEC